MMHAPPAGFAFAARDSLRTHKRRLRILSPYADTDKAAAQGKRGSNRSELSLCDNGTYPSHAGWKLRRTDEGAPPAVSDREPGDCAPDLFGPKAENCGKPDT